MQRGFTLVELLIVIAILAVLSVTVVVVLNPAELLKQARDSTRISDLASINSAIALYLTDIASPGIGGINDTACSARLGRLTAGGTSPFLAGMTPTVDSTTEVDGNAWVTVDLANITGGSPLSRMPLDPVNSTTYFYGYACGNNSQPLQYELDANMESTKYAAGGTSDVEGNSKDGGDNATIYETGNNLAQ
ncbi:MAG: prepilin-type N-terminal cleavage/methylation domain-containing protein [Patescibacteria group bacterium]